MRKLGLCRVYGPTPIDLGIDPATGIALPKRPVTWFRVRLLLLSAQGLQCKVLRLEFANSLKPAQIHCVAYLYLGLDRCSSLISRT